MSFKHIDNDNLYMLGFESKSYFFPEGQTTGCKLACLVPVPGTIWLTDMACEMDAWTVVWIAQSCAWVKGEELDWPSSAAPKMSSTEEDLIGGWFSGSSSMLLAVSDTSSPPSSWSSATETWSSLTFVCFDLSALLRVHLATRDDLAGGFIETSSARLTAASNCVRVPAIGRLRACRRRRRTSFDRAARFSLRAFLPCGVARL